jgi:hypothetical protein
MRDPNFVQIGNVDLIAARRLHAIPHPPGGTLADYVPFYFTSRSPMFLNIHTGWRGIQQRRNDEIVVVVSSVPQLLQMNVPFLFSDRHASLQAAQFSNDAAHLNRIDWTILRNSDFKADPEDPQKRERYEAECLIHQCLPVSAIVAIGCVNEVVVNEMQALMNASGQRVPVVARPRWYF